MRKEFVSYETALELKELGFNEECFWWYDFEGKLRQDIYTTNNNSKYFTEGNSCSAQLFQQAFKFFRDKYRLDCFIEKTTGGGDGISQIYVGIYYRHLCDVKDLNYSTKNVYDTYEEAEIECLKQLIKIAKQIV